MNNSDKKPLILYNENLISKDKKPNSKILKIKKLNTTFYPISNFYKDITRFI